jgi:hypothetical protein
MVRNTIFSLLDQEYHGSVIRAATENVNYGRPDEVPARVILVRINRPTLNWINFRGYSVKSARTLCHAAVTWSASFNSLFWGFTIPPYHSQSCQRMKNPLMPDSAFSVGIQILSIRNGLTPWRNYSKKHLSALWIF